MSSQTEVVLLQAIAQLSSADVHLGSRDRM